MRDKDFPYENLAYYGYDTIKKKERRACLFLFLNNTQLRKIRNVLPFLLEKSEFEFTFLNQNRVPIRSENRQAIQSEPDSDCKILLFRGWIIFLLGCAGCVFTGTGEKGESIGTRFRLRNVFLERFYSCRRFSPHQKSYYLKRCILKQKKGGRKWWKTKRLHM